jgi:hypothetical protein
VVPRGCLVARRNPNMGPWGGATFLVLLSACARSILRIGLLSLDTWYPLSMNTSVRTPLWPRLGRDSTSNRLSNPGLSSWLVDGLSVGRSLRGGRRRSLDGGSRGLWSRRVGLRCQLAFGRFGCGRRSRGGRDLRCLGKKREMRGWSGILTAHAIYNDEKVCRHICD